MSDTELDLSAELASASAMEGEAMILQAKAAMIRIKAELIPLFSERLTAAVCAEIERQNAEEPRRLAGAAVERLSLELAEVESRARQAAQAVASPDVHDRLDGRVRAAACEAEAESLKAKLAQARAEAGAAQTAYRLAELRVKHTKAAAAAALDAVNNPLTSDLGMSTEAYKSWLVDSGMWRNDPKSDVTRDLILGMLSATGIGREVQESAIRAYLAGDPLALAVGGTDHLADGHTVMHSPGAPSLVTRNPRLSGHQAAAEAAKPLPQAPADLSARVQAWTRDVIS